MVAWTIALSLGFVIWFLGILVGLAVGEVASRLAKRRNNVWLEIVVGAAIVGSNAIASVVSVHIQTAIYEGRYGDFGSSAFSTLAFSVIPVVLAVVAGITRLRR